MDVDPYDDTRTSADGEVDGPGTRLAAGATIGRYQVRGVLGAGGMGVVYRAFDPELGRELAIKVVTPGTTSGKAQDRLLDEARAMAKLRHAHIVPVFDVGSTTAGVYIVMPLYSGGTLRDWMHAEARPWRQVVARFLEAGRGLVAAHGAGIVHRDFKPRNVLLSESGEVMVADFGIASPSAFEHGEGDGDDTTHGTSTIAGTPAYMAPEQAAGQAVDARADQYSFCVSLWEGLHGQRPQEAETRTQGALLERSPDAPKSRRRVPGWLTDAVARGFSPAPGKRWPTLARLLDVLERGLGRKRRALVAGAALVVVGLGAFVVLARSRAGDPCGAADAPIAAMWNPKTRASVEGAIRAALPGFADETISRTTPGLARYAGQLSSVTSTVCRATRVERTQSERVMDLRMACLAERQSALQSTLTALSGAQQDIALRAVKLVNALPEIESCTESKAVLEAPFLSASQRPRVEALTQRLDSSRQISLRGEYDDYLDEAKRMADEAREIGYAPITVRALRVLNQALSLAEQDSTLVDQELARVAAVAHDDAALAIAWASVIYDIHAASGDPAAAKALEPVMAAAIERAGGARPLRYRGALSTAFVALMEGRFRDAATAFQSAVELADSDIERSQAQGNVASALLQAGDDKAAVAAMERALAFAATAYGEHHPQTSLARATLARRQLRVGEVEAAAASLKRAESDLSAVLGAKSSWLIEVYEAAGDLAAARGDGVAVLRSRQLIVDIDNEVGRVSRLRCSHLIGLADAHAEAGSLELAAPIFEAGMRCYEPIAGRDSYEYALSESNLAQYLVTDGACGKATPMLEHALGVLEGHAAVVLPLSSLARCGYRAGRRDEAYAAVEKALAICDRRACPPDVKPSMMSMLGGWLIEGGRATRPRGVEMSRDAARRYRELGNTEEAARIEARLRE